MSRLAGFDLAFELSPRAVEELVRPQLSLGGVNYAPPAEVILLIPPMSGGGKIHFVITGFSVEILPDARISLQISFQRGSILGRSGGPDAAASLGPSRSAPA